MPDKAGRDADALWFMVSFLVGHSCPCGGKLAQVFAVIALPERVHDGKCRLFLNPVPWCVAWGDLFGLSSGMLRKDIGGLCVGHVRHGPEPVIV